MKKQLIKATIALGVLMVLLLLGWWKDQKLEEKSQKEEKDKTLLELNLDDADKLSIRTPKDVFEFQKVKEDEFLFIKNDFKIHSKWKVTKPYSWIADHSVISNIRNKLKKIEHEKQIAKDQNNLSDYGLKPAKIEIEVGGKTIWLGEKNTADTHRYAAVSGKPGIYLVKLDFDFLLDKDGKDYREKRIFGHPDLSQVSGATLEKDGKVKFILSKKDGEWFLEKPYGVPASKTEVENFLRAPNAMQASNWLPNESRIKNPHIVISTKTGENEKTLKIANSKTEKTWVERTGFDGSFEVPTEFAEKLSPAPEDLIRKRILFSEAKEVDRMKVWQEGKEFELQRKENIWHLVTDGRASDQELKNSFKIFDLKGQKYIGSTQPKNAGEKTLHIQLFQGQEAKESMTIFDMNRENPIGLSSQYKMYYEFDKSEVEAIQNLLRDVITKKVQDEDIVVPEAPEHEGHDHE